MVRQKPQPGHKPLCACIPFARQLWYATPPEAPAARGDAQAPEALVLAAGIRGCLVGAGLAT